MTGRLLLLSMLILGSQPARAQEAPETLESSTEESERIGRLWWTVNGGLTLGSRPRPRVMGGLRWHPFPDSSWGGLSNAGVLGELILTPTGDGNLGLILWLTYGKPRPGFWMAFDAGLINILGWGQGSNDTVGFQAAPAAALRLAVSFISLRVLGIVTSAKKAISPSQFYQASVEFTWPL